MVVIAPPPSLSPPSEQAMTESSRGAPLHIPTTLQNAIVQSTGSASTSAPSHHTSGNGASISHYNRHFSAAQSQYNGGLHTQAPYINTRKTRPYSQYTNGIPTHRSNQQIYPALPPPTNGNTGLLTTVTPRHHNHNHNNGHLYHHCTFPCSATSVLTGGDATLPTRFSFGPGFEPQPLFGVGQYGARAGAGATPRVSQQLQQQHGAAVASNHQEHIVLFHVNPGVTIRFQIGENLEVLRD